ncbi:MAG: hypothetical protein KME29_02370 [Calothrix sp. FI2-JRJ7]|jgi:uncharacterized protein involved in exopolysaccharide biosynthesis|nr:hypothetical protein [Calothrix sp. FI2-JRJ7]
MQVEIIDISSPQWLPGQQIASTSNLQLGTLKQDLSRELVQLESRRLGLASQLATLTGLETTYRQRLNNLPKLEQEKKKV